MLLKDRVVLITNVERFAGHGTTRVALAEGESNRLGLVRGVTSTVPLVRRQVRLSEGRWPGAGEILVGKLAYAKIGCAPETLRNWVRQSERDTGKRAGLTTNERERLKELERENRELKRANEILRKASAFFAQAELDRRAR